MSSACTHEGCVCQPLPSVKRGERMIVRHLHGESGDCHRLREMGFCESSEVRLVCAGGAIIAQVQGAKICLSHHMAQSIMVTAV